MAPLRYALFRLSTVIIAFWTLTLLPSPSEAIPLRLKNGIVGIVAILWIGKTLYDTLFYERRRS